MPFKNIELALDRAFALAILSSFSNHQYFMNGEISSYQEFLKNYLEYLNDGKNFVFIEICDLITVGSNETVFHSYIDCYTIVEFVSGTGPGVGNSNNTDHTDPHSTYPPDENIPRSGGNSNETSSGSIGGPNYEPDELCKEQINGQLLSFINNQLNFVLPCDEESPMQVRDQIMDDLCESGRFISVNEFLNRLNEYNWIDMNGSTDDIWNQIDEIRPECPIAFPTCPASFDNFMNTGSGATIEIECDGIVTFVAETPDDLLRSDSWTQYTLGPFCISTGSLEILHDGSTELLGSRTRTQLTAKAYDLARDAIYHANANRFRNYEDPLSHLEANNLFKTKLLNELRARMTGVNVSTGVCAGNIPSIIPTTKIGYICAQRSCYN